MATAKRLKLRCFLEGQEVPIVALNVQVAPNSPMLATIQLPPFSEGTKLKPRTLVHVFFLDFWDEAPKTTYKRGDSINERDRGPASTYDFSLARYQDQPINEHIEDIETDMRNQRYKLVFGGEVVGFEWVKTPTSRSLILKCQDWSSYWDQAQQFQNTDLFGPGYKALFSGGGTNLFTDFLSSPSEVIINLVNSRSIQYPRLEGLLGGLVHLLEAIGGAYFTRDGKAFAGQNIFFSVAELRLHITQMITAYENDPSSKRLLGGSYDGLFGRTLGNLGDQVSFRKAINALMGVIFHESYAQPCPLYQPGNKGTLDGYERTNITDDPELSVIASDAETLAQSTKTIKNAIIESAVQGNPKSTKDDVILSLKNIKKGCADLNTKAVKLKFTKATRLINDAKTSIGQAENKVRTAWKNGLSEASISYVGSRLDSAELNLKLVTQMQVTKTNRKNALPARLNQQIFRPDVWFTAPPRCNVIFPEQYYMLQYIRSFLEEPTRLMLKTNDEFFGEDELFDALYFAPKLPKASMLKNQSNDLWKLLQGDIMSHEIYTGIVPVFEKMGEFNIFGVRAGTAPPKKGAGKKAKGRTVKVGLAQRSTNFLFFRYRFAARQMQIAGTFNPYIACGFPGFIIDKYVDLDRLRKMRDMMVYAGYKYRPLTDMLGTHFLGNFTSVVHTIDQNQGGETTIQVQYPREFNESVEFLGASNKDTMQAEKRLDADALRETDVAAIDRPPLYSLGPQFGVIVEATDVTSSYAAATAAGASQAQKLPFYGGPRRKGTGELTMKVPIGVTLEAKQWGQEVVDAVGSETKKVSFRAYRIKEQVPRYRREEILLPAEELIRPGWYGDCWHPSQIGQVYEQFFRTGAITDPQQVADPSGTSTGVITEDAEDALLTAASGTDREDPRTLAPAIMALDAGATIQQACTFLLQVYSYIKMNGLNIDEFIRSYTWRPIANMVDILGSSDLQLNEDGSKVVRGIEGFHSRAFGPYQDLFALVTPEIETVLGVKRGSSLAKKADTRKAKWEAVRDLVDALKSSKAVIG
jgi:hypothetical protein